MMLSILSALAFTTLCQAAAPLKVLKYVKTPDGFTSPARGWNSFGMQANSATNPDFKFDQAHTTEQCDLLASKLGAANYPYCSLDSGWSIGGNGDEYGRIIYDDTVFNIPDMARHLHERGLKMGVYVVPGAFQADLNKTILGTNTKIGDVCSGDEGLARCVFDYTKPEVQTWHDSVVAQFAEWGVDFIKLDFVTPGSPDNGQNLPADQSACVPAWQNAIIHSGRQMRLDISWKLDRTPKYFKLWSQHADSMRTDQDINNGGEPTFIAWKTVQRAIENYRQWVVAASSIFGDKVSIYPDLDNMYVGNAASITGVSDKERQSIMTHWIGAGANLITGSDLTNLDALGVRLLTNKAALAIADFTAQYPMQPRNPGTGGHDPKQLQAWIAGPSSKGDEAVVVLANYGPDQGSGGWGGGSSSKAGKQTVSVSWADLGISGDRKWRVYDVWGCKVLGGQGKDGIQVSLDEGESVLLKLTRTG